MTPPGRVLEIGCGHGGFVALLGEAGFDAMGTELSPWVADFARSVFGVRVELASIETLVLAPGFHAVCAFDVLEHVRDPLGFARRVRALLTEEGVLFLQTPCYRGEGPTWEMFQEREHIFLLSETAIRRLLEEAGFHAITVRPGLFPYDMWVMAAGETSPRALEPAVALPAWTRALLALRAELARTDARRAQAETDRAARLIQIEVLTERLREAEGDRAARLTQVEALTERLREAEGDRAARLTQVEALTERLREAEGDRAARLTQVEALTAGLQEAETDRAARLAQIDTLTAWLREAETARLTQLEALREGLRIVETDRAAKLAEVDQLHAQLEAIHRSWAWRASRFLQWRGGRRP